MSLFGHQHLHGSNYHICGCYYTWNRQRKYLPQVRLDSRTTLTPVSFETTLTQRFHNPNDAAVPQIRYTFPLYDGVAVCGYTVSYADKSLKGIVKERAAAKQTFKTAVDRGETAGLLESLPAGVFGVTLANVPAATDIIVEITYCGELKHDAGIDGLRFMLPTSIAPRYGTYPGQVMNSNAVPVDGMKITVDIDMGDSKVRKVQSPSHPIALQMGELSTALRDTQATEAPFSNSQASACLSQGSCELSGDFVLQVQIDDISRPQGIVETHPDLSGQRALMATLVPKFALKPASPEIVFIADQSGSMSGAKNKALVASLQIFIKSLPAGVRFNICAFGNRYRFLWAKSRAYKEDHVNEALAFVSDLQASYGGTEMLEPIKATFENHLKDFPLEIMLLTDGAIWQEQQVFQYINKQVHDKSVNARVFALGIGQDVSHTLVEGIARAGNGFAQFVTQNEDTDAKIIRMLKAALYPHTKDYTLEINYNPDPGSEEVDDFEIVERLSNLLTVSDTPSKVEEKPKSYKPQSFFDSSADLDTTMNKEPVDRYAHLPVLVPPRVLRAPLTIPPLFPFSRSTVYMLLGPESAQKEIRSITLRAQAPSGPLELDIPISAKIQGTSVHQLAARKAIQDLEEGRGWLQSATSSEDAETLIKEKYEGRFDEIVEREAVRLGERFQVASKWTSFVAVNTEGNHDEKTENDENQPVTAVHRDRDITASAPFGSSRTGGAPRRRSALPDQSGGLFGSSNMSPMGGSSGFGAVRIDACMGSPAIGMGRSHVSPAIPPRRGRTQPDRSVFANQSSGALFGSAASFGSSVQQANVALALAPASPQIDQATMQRYQQEMQQACNMPIADEEEPESDEDFGLIDPPLSEGRSCFLKADESDDDESDQDMAMGSFDSPPRAKAPKPAEDMGFGLFDSPPHAQASALPAPAPPVPASAPSASVMHKLIGLQMFNGSWKWSQELLTLIGVDEAQVQLSKFANNADRAATAFVVAFFEDKLGEKKDVWEFVVAKARAFLLRKVGSEAKVEGAVKAAAACLRH
ncbi:von Willebrand factor A domain-containing protein [Pseudocercospora fuligena]|uniref:von Willebrand factor A domain-containing protein n=1 Tax=Pseudocercospora fuligena TaxID=685502 RepID=A0A8H6RML2_9PEZI|nr:von Willebrand factor A domain-containing protein [Pseudocercospora fuligena]